MITEQYQEVSEEDYKELENKFKEVLDETNISVVQYPELRETLDKFIFEVGNHTKVLLQKYGKTDYIHKLEVEDYRDQMMDMKRKMVKMKLRVRQISNACNAFNNVSKK